VRPSHRALHGKIFHYSVVQEKNLFPPISYRCRCTLRPMTKEMATDSEGDIYHEPPDKLLNPDTGEPITVRPDEGFGLSPDDYNFGIAEFFEEAFPAIRDDLAKWDEIGRPDSRNVIGIENAPNILVDLDNYIRDNPGLSDADIQRVIREKTIERHGDLAVGWPARFELHLPSVFKDRILFGEGSLRHVSKKFQKGGQDRIRHFSALVDTIENPWEVWANQNKSTGEWGLSYIKLYKEKNRNLYSRVDIYPSNGVKVTTYYVTRRLSTINNNRNGILVYKNDNLIK